MKHCTTCFISSLEKTTVLILGAGITGITAAHTFQHSGLSDFLVIEGSNRIGGRMLERQICGKLKNHLIIFIKINIIEKVSLIIEIFLILIYVALLIIENKIRDYKFIFKKVFYIKWTIDNNIRNELNRSNSRNGAELDSWASK